jgi:hypothetical protein
VDELEARTVLGVGATADRSEVRAAYRRLIRAAHPDVTGTGETLDAARLNEAYAVLVRVRRAADLPATPSPASPRPTRTTEGRTEGPTDVRTDRATLHLPWPAPESFARVVEAGHDLGEVTYVDRSCAILEVVVDVDGEACSLVCTFRPAGRSSRDGTDVRCTLEALERVATLPPAPIVAILGQFVRDGA